jgi:hypothetical protein
VFVGATAEVMFEGAPYSMPPKAAHVAGTLFLYEREVHIVTGRFEARHRRRTKHEPPAPLPEHRAEKIAAVHGTRAKLYEKRQQLLNLGRHALEVLTEITHREPKLASRRVEELYTLLDTHGDDAMRAAFAHAVDRGQLSITGVRRAFSSSARRGDGDSHCPGVAQPRGDAERQMEIAFPRVAARGGVS